MLFFELAFSFTVMCLGLHSVSVKIYYGLLNNYQALYNVDYSTLLNLSPNNGLT